jgi:SAM-dependent methyltransferase
MTIPVYQAYYNDPQVIGHYVHPGGLYPAEAALLSRMKNELQDQSILDIGMGGGRTTAYLQSISQAYTGIDLSEGMIRSARQRFPGANLLVCDARDLSRFQDGHFAAVFFLGAGIDEVNVRDRLQILNEINRVLRRNGVFISAIHNLDAGCRNSGMAPGLRLSDNLRGLITDNLLRARSVISHCTRRMWQKINDKGYIVCMDYDECFSDSRKCGILLPTYYIRKDAQIQQLMENGFDQVEAIDQKGEVLTNGRIVKDQFLYYSARKSE